MDLVLGQRAIVAVVELNGIGDVVIALVHRVMLARYGAFARLALASDDGGIGGQDERGQRLLRLFDFWGKATSCAALGAHPLLVLFPEPSNED